MLSFFYISEFGCNYRAAPFFNGIFVLADFWWILLVTRNFNHPRCRSKKLAIYCVTWIWSLYGVIVFALTQGREECYPFIGCKYILISIAAVIFIVPGGLIYYTIKYTPRIRRINPLIDVKINLRKAKRWRVFLKENTEIECGICLDIQKKGDAVYVLPVCSHQFHECCIQRWLKVKARCPMCNNDLSEELPR